MRHAILGVGGIGGLVGGALARSGADVVLLMRPASLPSYSGRLSVESAVLGDFEVEAPATTTMPHGVNVVWVTPKATELSAALELAPPNVVGNARVVSLMNGVDHMSVLRQRYRRVIAGAIRVESERIDIGHIRQTSPFIRVEMSGAPDIVQELAATGIDCTLGGDETLILWRKLVFLAPLALATAAHGLPLGEIRNRADFQACQAEATSVAQAEGANIDSRALENLTANAPADMRSSMQKDVKKGIRPELDAIAGPILRGGAKHGIPTPATRQLADMIEGDARDLGHFG